MTSFLDLPFDIHVLISKSLEPMDLVHLSHVSKAYRRAFASRDALAIWNYAINELGLPPCPMDVPSPRYCSLILGPEICSICGKSTTREANFEFSARFCATCEPSEIATASQIFEELRYKGNHHLLVSLVPRYLDDSERASMLSERRYYKSKSKTSRDVRGILLSSSTNSPKQSYHRRQLSQLVREYDECCKQPSTLMYFVRERLAVATHRMQHAADVCMWLDDERERQALMKKAITEGRILDIKTRLGAAGWDTDLFNYVSTRWRQLVEKPEPLTDVEWPELLPELESLLEAARKARYRHRLVEALHLRYRSRVHNMTPEKQEIMFEWNTIVSVSYFQDVIMGPADFTPITFALLEEMYRKLYDHMISNHEAFRACLVKKLRNPTINCPLRPDELDYHSAYEDDALLDLATSLLTWTFEPDPLYSLNSYKQALSTMVFFQPRWDDDALSYSASTLLVARRVLKELGFPTDALMSEVVEALCTGVACICTHDTQAYWDCDLGYANLVFHVSKFHMTDTELFLLRL